MTLDDPRIEVQQRWPITAVHADPLPRSLAWRRSEVSDADWKIAIPDRCLAEIAATIATLRENPVPVLALSLADVSMPECRRLMDRVKAVLDRGIGFAVLDRLPVDCQSKAELQTIYWLLSQMLGRPVAQAFNGTLLYDVHDTGKKTDIRVRADLTNEDLSWHTDYGFNHPPPYIGLLVLRTALSGGVSSVGSLYTGHETLRERAPDLLRRLYEPFVWNRQGEHPDGAPVCTCNPIFSDHDGTVKARFNRNLLPVGYRLVDREIDQTGQDALNAMHEVMSEAENHVDFVLEPGQIEFLNNARVTHRRTAFVDHEEPDRKRHLMRIFLRDEGRRSYMG